MLPHFWCMTPRRQIYRARWIQSIISMIWIMIIGRWYVQKKWRCSWNFLHSNNGKSDAAWWSIQYTFRIYISIFTWRHSKKLVFPRWFKTKKLYASEIHTNNDCHKEKLLAKIAILMTMADWLRKRTQTLRIALCASTSASVRRNGDALVIAGLAAHNYIINSAKRQLMYKVDSH